MLQPLSSHLCQELGLYCSTHVSTILKMVVKSSTTVDRHDNLFYAFSLPSYYITCSFFFHFFHCVVHHFWFFQLLITTSIFASWSIVNVGIINWLVDVCFSALRFTVWMKTGNGRIKELGMFPLIIWRFLPKSSPYYWDYDFVWIAVHCLFTFLYCPIIYACSVLLTICMDLLWFSL